MVAEHEALDAFLRDRGDDFCQGILFCNEWLVPGRGAVGRIDDFEPPVVLVLQAKDRDTDGHAVACDFTAKVGVDDVWIVVHCGGTPGDRRPPG
jgi:hypothetical protein